MSDVGFTSRTNGKMSISDLQWMFKNPFFYGVMKFNGELWCAPSFLKERVLHLPLSVFDTFLGDSPLRLFHQISQVNTNRIGDS